MLKKLSNQYLFNFGVVLCSILLSSLTHADEEQLILKPISVSADSTSFIGIADSANVGIVTKKQLESRAVYRPAELLEAAPGLVVTQHSGEGKANQFFYVGLILTTVPIYALV